MVSNEIQKNLSFPRKRFDFAEFLTIQLSERIKKNSNYSLRSFARDLKVSPGNLSDLLGRKRNFSVKMVKKICANLALSPLQSQQFLSDLFGATNPVEDAYESNLISEDQFKIICDWRHFAILRLIKTHDFKPNSTWIAKRLGSSSFVINECRDRLVRVGLLEIKAGQWFDRSNGKTSYLKLDKSDQYIKKFLKSMLELSAESIERDDVSERNHTGMMVSISKKSLPAAVELIKNFRRSFAELLEESNLKKEEVYYLEVGLFPVTRKETVK